jgi:ABC-2 type transport system ATP-binding protein
MKVIEVEDLRKDYGNKVAVDGISFDVRKGEIFGMLGPNGAGKSTTIECLTGLKPRTGGKVKLLGLDPERDRKALYRRIGVQLQETSYQDHVKVAEICRLFASFYRKPLASESLLKRFGLDGRKNAAVQSLSGGQRQRLSIVLALIANPEVVFLDELTTGLDPQARRAIWACVRDLKDEGRTVFLTTHFMEEAELLCDRLCIVNGGKVVALDTVSSILVGSGIDSVVTVETPASPEIFHGLSGVKRADAKDGRIVVHGSGRRFLGGIVQALEASGADYGELSYKKPNLEDVFLSMTGTSFVQ